MKVAGYLLALLLSLGDAPSLKPVFLAGRIVSTSKPDGIGSQAFIDQATTITGCGSKLYFYDRYGFRQADPATGAVVTLFASDTLRPPSCDGTYVYDTNTVFGPLVVNRYEISTGQRSSFSFPQIDSFKQGLYEYSVVADGALYTADSASGRIWKIDPVTMTRTVVIDFGGPVIIPKAPGMGGPPFSIGVVGRFWVDGTNLYVLRSGAIQRIDLENAAVTRLMDWTSGFLWGESHFLHFRGGKLDVTTGDVTSVADSEAEGLWGDPEFLYFTESIDLRKINRSTGAVTTIAGELPQRIDGAGSAARFADTLTRFMSITGDSKSLYISDAGMIRVFDKASGQLSTLSGVGPFDVGSIWTDGNILLLSDHSCIRKVDLASHQVTVLAGIPGQTLDQFADGVGPDARFAYAQDLWSDGRYLYVNDNYSAIRKVELATGRVTTVLNSKRYGGEGSHSIGGMWGVGRRLYYRDERAIWTMDLDTEQVRLVSDKVGLSFPDGLWGDGTNLYVVEGSGTIKRLDLSSGSVSTLYASAELISDGIYGDASGLYVVEAFSLRRLEPDAFTRMFGMGISGLTVLDVDPAPSLTTIQSEVHAAPATPSASGTAIWSYRNPNGVLVSEAAVPGQLPMGSGRIYADVNGPVNTGIALSNPNDVDVRVDFYFTDSAGQDFGNGSTVLAPHTELARFLDEPPFAGGKGVQGTFSFTASLPVVAIALRGFTNERSEFLMTTLPVANLDAAVRDPATMAHYASGGGWTTQVLLVNPAGESSSGSVRFFDDSGVERNRENYQLAPRSSSRIMLGNTGAEIVVGSVTVEPSAGTATPTSVAVFSYVSNGITVTETGAASAEGSLLSSYVDLSRPSDADPVNSGIAIANPGEETVRLFLRPTFPSGDNAGQGLSITLPPHGHFAKFISELFPNIPAPFTGVLHVIANIADSATPANVSITGLRGRYNSRNEFLVATVTSVVVAGSGTTQFYMPHLVSGSGYSTRVFLVNTAHTWTAGDIRFRTPDGNLVPLKK